MHLLSVQGFYFALLQYSPIQAFTVRFVPSMQLYNQRRKTAHAALHALFRRFDRFHRPRYNANTTSHCTACDMLKRLPDPGRFAPIPEPAPLRRLYRSAQPPIIIRYIRVRPLLWIHARRCNTPARRGQLLPSANRWQVLTRCQQYRRDAPAEGSASPPAQGSPAAVSMLPTPGINLAPG